MVTQPMEVLLVEDSPADARLLIESLKEPDSGAFRVTRVSRLREAVEALAGARPEVVLLDLSLPDSTGLATVERLRAAAPVVPIVVLTGLQDEKLALEAVRHGVQDYLVKGQCENGLAARALRYAVERNRKDRELAARARQQAAVAWLGQVALERQDVQAVMDEAVRQLAQTLDAELTKVLELQPDGQSLLLRAGTGWDDGLVGRATVSTGKDSQAGYTLLSGDPVVVADLPSETRFSGPPLLRRHGVVSGMSTAIAAPGGGRPYGVLGVHTRKPRRFTADDVHFLHAVANVLAATIGRRRAEQALRESEVRFRTLADGSPVLMWVNGPEGAEFVNRAYLEFLGVRDEAGVRRYDWTQFVHPDDRDTYVGQYLDCLARRADFDAEFRFRRHDGEYRWMRSIGRPRFTPAGEFLGYVGSSVDRTEFKRAEDAMRDSLTRLSAVVDTAVDAIITIDERGRIESVNPATERLFGYARDEMVGHNVKLLMPEPYRGEHDGYIQRYLRTGDARIIGIGREVVGLRKDGSTAPLNLSVSEFRLGGRRMFTGILHDVTERRRLEREVLDISSAEQRRIGQDLHDGLCQELVGVAFATKLLAGRLQGKLPEEAAAVRDVAALVDGAIDQARALAHGLSPVELQGGDLAAALVALAAKVSSLFQVACQCRCDERLVLADGSTATHLYRIAQEAVSNAVKHGRAGEIELALTSTDAWVTLSVKDDGRGMPAVLPATAGIGLSTMSYRARVIGASFSVQPRPGRGTVVTCVLPRHAARGAAAAEGDETTRKRGGAARRSSRSGKSTPSNP